VPRNIESETRRKGQFLSKISEWKRYQKDIRDDGFHQNHHHHALLKTITRERCERDLIPRMQTQILLPRVHFFKAFEKRERAFARAFFLSLSFIARRGENVFSFFFALFLLFFRLKRDDDDALGFRTKPTPRERCAFKNVPSSPE
jgi:hypothetical protein